jgi:hypothetical protein
VGKPEFVEEDRVEVLVTDTEGKGEIKNIVEQLKKVGNSIYTLGMFFPSSRLTRSTRMKRLPSMCIGWKIFENTSLQAHWQLRCIWNAAYDLEAWQITINVMCAIDITVD